MLARDRKRLRRNNEKKRRDSSPGEKIRREEASSAELNAGVGTSHFFIILSPKDEEKSCRNRIGHGDDKVDWCM